MKKEEAVVIAIESKGLLHGSEYCEIVISRHGYIDTRVPVLGTDFEDVAYVTELVRGAVKEMIKIENKTI